MSTGRDVTPDFKTASGTRKSERGRRKATKADWTRLHKMKGAPCRLCGKPYQNLHHLIGRAQLGPDEEWNLVPLCGQGNASGCHGLVERNEPDALRALAKNLTDGEYAGLVAHGGEGIVERLFGVMSR